MQLLDAAYERSVGEEVIQQVVHAVTPVVALVGGVVDRLLVRWPVRVPAG